MSTPNDMPQHSRPNPPAWMIRADIDAAISALSKKVTETCDGELASDLAALVDAAAKFGDTHLQARRFHRQDRGYETAEGPNVG